MLYYTIIVGRFGRAVLGKNYTLSVGLQFGNVLFCSIPNCRSFGFQLYYLLRFAVCGVAVSVTVVLRCFGCVLRSGCGFKKLDRNRNRNR